MISGHTPQLSGPFVYDSELIGFVSLFLTRDGGCSGFTPTHWAFQNPLWFRASTGTNPLTLPPIHGLLLNSFIWIAHTTDFVPPAMEHWLEREIAQ